MQPFRPRLFLVSRKEIILSPANTTDTIVPLSSLLLAPPTAERSRGGANRVVHKQEATAGNIPQHRHKHCGCGCSCGGGPGTCFLGTSWSCLVLSTTPLKSTSTSSHGECLQFYFLQSVCANVTWQTLFTALCSHSMF